MRILDSISSETEIYINKIEVARRQIDAAIRMTLANEDQIAIHTIASAGYRVARDLLEKRNKNDTDEIIRAGLFRIASKIASIDDPDAIFDQLGIKDTYSRSKILEISAEIKRKGKNFDVSQIRMTISHEGRKQEYAQIARAYNFSKHADKDNLSLIDMKAFKNEEVLIRAVTAYAMLMPEITDEMHVYQLMYFSSSPKRASDYDGVDKETVVKFSKLSPAKRRQSAGKMLKIYRRWTNEESKS